MQSKAIRFHSTGDVEVLKYESVEVPEPKDNEVTIRHEAIGLNFIDTYYRGGLYPVSLPSGLGNEAAGVIEKVGSAVNHLKVGDRVAYGQGPLGAYSQKRTMPAHHLVKIPEGISFEEAAAVMLKGLTVQYLFRQTYKIKEGETILFHAAAGGVGLIACQWAKALGVKLIGTVSSEEKAAIAKSHGAWATINYSKENVAEKVKVLTEGKKVPVVYDGVGKDTWETSLDCLSPRGLMVSFGNASGPVTGINLGILSQKGSLYVTRPSLGGYIDTPEKLQAASEEVFEMVLTKKIKIEINQHYPLKEAAKAHEALTSRKTTGATILIP
ncbi:quinone oxidoreductase family protein [Bdellovibrio reynosensis]|uniref:Quinone oxidoreductase n=1 Tax=Bdellovibrio reynosensis TaxID=2835041 RepID=A0ABY4CC92_9BACT|nr:quinone oxidoreductase [Bdellovibrio reynosensis]UOF01331.1 quinone oxidoreductase [Bdellovibrio reynosensis]